MNKILKFLSVCSIGVALPIALATSKASATDYRVSPAEGLSTCICKC